MKTFHPNQTFIHSEQVFFRKDENAIAVLHIGSDDVYFKLKGLTRDVWIEMESKKTFQELLDLTKRISNQQEKNCVEFLEKFLNDLLSKNLITTNVKK